MRYLACWDGVYVIDVSDPTNPEEPEGSHVSTGSAGADATPIGDHVYVVGGFLRASRRLRKKATQEIS